MMTAAQIKAKTELTFSLREMVRSLPPSELTATLASELVSHIGPDIAESVLRAASDYAREKR